MEDSGRAKEKHGQLFARKKVRQREEETTRLTSSSRPSDNSDLLPTLDRKVDPLENSRKSSSVAHEDVLHLDLPRLGPGRSRFGVLPLVGCLLRDGVVGVARDSLSSIHVVLHFGRLPETRRKGSLIRRRSSQQFVSFRLWGVCRERPQKRRRDSPGEHSEHLHERDGVRQKQTGLRRTDS